jgi:hypothetical protein
VFFVTSMPKWYKEDVSRVGQSSGDSLVEKNRRLVSDGCQPQSLDSRSLELSWIKSCDCSQNERKLLVTMNMEAEDNDENRAEWEEFIHAIVNCRVCEIVIVLWLLVVTNCKYSTKPITNPYIIYSHSNMWQYDWGKHFPHARNFVSTFYIYIARPWHESSLYNNFKPYSPLMLLISKCMILIQMFLHIKCTIQETVSVILT